MYKIFVLYVMRMETHQKAHHYTWTKKNNNNDKNTIVSGNEGDKKNLPWVAANLFF